MQPGVEQSVPDAQEAHEEAPVDDAYVPVRHGEHCEAPGALANVPNAQKTQDVALAAGLQDPAGQDGHELAPADPANVPTEHPAHCETPSKVE